MIIENVEQVGRFLNSNFLQTLATAIIGIYAYKISKAQKETIDTVEMFANYLGVEYSDVNNAKVIKPYIMLQNIGTNLIYMKEYVFNGRKFILNNQILPSVYSNAQASQYNIELPTNAEIHVFLTVEFLDRRNIKYLSEIIADKVDGIWKISTYPTKKI